MTLRRIVDQAWWQTRYHGPDTWSVTLTLECGHKAQRKGSEVKDDQVMAKCHECTEAENQRRWKERQC